MMKTLIILCILSASFLQLDKVQADVKVIANKDAGVTTLSKKQLEDIYFGYKKLWDNGKKIEVSQLANTGDLDSFLSLVGSKSKSYRKHWTVKVLSGKGVAPKIFPSEEELVGYVKKTPGAVGFVVSGTEPAGAVVVSIQ